MKKNKRKPWKDGVCKCEYRDVEESLFVYHSNCPADGSGGMFCAMAFLVWAVLLGPGIWTVGAYYLIGLPILIALKTTT